MREQEQELTQAHAQLQLQLRLTSLQKSFAGKDAQLAQLVESHSALGRGAARLLHHEAHNSTLQHVVHAIPGPGVIVQHASSALERAACALRHPLALRGAGRETAVQCTSAGDVRSRSVVLRWNVGLPCSGSLAAASRRWAISHTCDFERTHGSSGGKRSCACTSDTTCMHTADCCRLYMGFNQIGRQPDTTTRCSSKIFCCQPSECADLC